MQKHSPQHPLRRLVLALALGAASAAQAEPVREGGGDGGVILLPSGAVTIGRTEVRVDQVGANDSTANVDQGLAGSTPASNAYVLQTGDSGVVNVIQTTSAGQTALVKQAGNHYNARLEQYFGDSASFPGSTAASNVLNQVGAAGILAPETAKRNFGVITQGVASVFAGTVSDSPETSGEGVGSGAHAYLFQAGSQQRGRINQLGGATNDAKLFQYGGQNGSTKETGYLEQSGSGNTALVEQIRGTNDVAQLFQSGSDNLAKLHQEDSNGAKAKVTQGGSNQMLDLTQEGVTNATANVMQACAGSCQMTLNQTASFATITANQTGGSNNNINIDQH